MKSEKGLTLIEVVISIMVLGLVAAAIVGYFQWSLGVFGYVDRKATSESLARSQMEKIKSDNWSASGTYSLIPGIPPGYQVYGYSSSNVTWFGETVSGNTTAPMQKILVTVVRTDNPSDNVTLEGYKLKR